MSVEQADIIRFFEGNWHRLEMPETYLGDEPNTYPEWENTKMRVLLVRLSSYDATSSSMTVPILQQFIHDYAPDPRIPLYADRVGADGRIFVDRCWLPSRKNAEQFQRAQIPFMFGSASKRPAKDFDLIMVTNSVTMEAVNIVYMLHNSGIPLMKSERIDNPEMPFILLGGANVKGTEHFYGDNPSPDEINFDPRVHGMGGLCDAAVIGQGENSVAQFLAAFEKAVAEKWTKRELLRYCHGEVGSNPRVDGFYEADQYSVGYFLEDTPMGMYKDLSGYLIDSEAGKGLKITEDIAAKPLGDLAYVRAKYPWVNDIVFSAKGTLPGGPPAVSWKDRLHQDAPNYIHIDEVPALTRPYIPYDGRAPTVDLEIAKGCGAFCSFCQESWVNKGYNERSASYLLNAFDVARKYKGASKANLYAFNWSFHRDIYPLLDGLMSRIGRVGLISNRIDVAAANPEMVRLGNACGVSTATLGVEGISQRLRGYLSKSASISQIQTACRWHFRYGYNEIKLFMIATGLEEDRDIDEFEKIMESIIDIREEEGSTCSVRVSFTPLFMCSGAPLEFEVQRSAFMARDGIRSLDRAVEICRRLGIGFRTSAKRAEVGVSCLLESGDRRLTRVLITCAIENQFVFYGMVPKTEFATWGNTLEAVTGMTFDHYWRAKARHQVLPWEHMIFGGVPKQVLWDLFEKTQRFEDAGYCLTTRFQKGGCLQCGGCDNQFEVHDIVHREESATMSVADLMSRAKSLQKRQTLRWKFEVEPSHRTVPKACWQYVIARAFMFAHPEGVEAYSKFSGFSAATVSKIRDWSYGIEYADMALNKSLRLEDKEDLIEEMQKYVRGIKILDVRSYADSKSLRTSGTSVWYTVQIPHYGLKDVESYLYQLAERENITIKKKIPEGKSGFRIIDVELEEHDLQEALVFFDPNVGVRMEMLLSPTTGPLEILRSIFNTGIGRVSSWNVMRRDYLIKEEAKKKNASEDLQFDYFAPSGGICKKTGVSIERNLFGDYVHEHLCLKETLIQMIRETPEFGGSSSFGIAHLNEQLGREAVKVIATSYEVAAK